MSNRRILITGMAGFVGSWITRLAVRAGWEVHGLVRAAGNRGRLAGLEGAATSHEADLRDYSGVETVVKRLAPACVVHAAFPGAHAPDAAARRTMVESGLVGTANLLEAIRATGSVEHLVHVGSAAAYGPAARPHHPLDPLKPATFRGACKAGAWLLCQQFALATGTFCTEVRLFNVYGPAEQPNRLLPQLLKAALERRTIRLTAEPHQRNWIYIEDAAEACLAALQTTSTVPPVINAGWDEVVTTHDFARRLEGIVGRSLVGSHDYDQADLYGDPDLRCVMPGPGEEITWRPRTRLADGLRLSWDWAQTPAGRHHLGVSP